VPRGGQTHAEVRKRRKGMVRSGLPVGAERRKGKMGDRLMGKGGGGGGVRALAVTTARSRRACYG
jgi:hypothetical protein